MTSGSCLEDFRFEAPRDRVLNPLALRLVVTRQLQLTGVSHREEAVGSRELEAAQNGSNRKFLRGFHSHLKQNGSKMGTGPYSEPTPCRPAWRTKPKSHENTTVTYKL